MRIGNSKSKSYQRYHQRKYMKKRDQIKYLENRLDYQVQYAESFRVGTKSRRMWYERAHRTREALRKIE